MEYDSVAYHMLFDVFLDNHVGIDKNLPRAHFVTHHSNFLCFTKILHYHVSLDIFLFFILTWYNISYVRDFLA